ncbi:MAG: class I adenylate-forming enzyme family protein [Dehalococcoidales bacterium]|jgi:acyl-CoA synthetase (AMP-forming)/AMP-acid ligase II|nr:class I adenylate-forming enzyme family protein [Dehalococcoidales bacterium]MDD3994595.1 class I adenylate-forming enzyme family protein [Dehalococcoidales bacterium]
MTIADMLAKNAKLYPDDIALVELKPSLNYRCEITWREFDNRSNKIANALYNTGIRKGDKVVHLMTNSIDWLVAYFGIIRTGAWAVPLNFRFTAKDILYCTQIAEAKAFLFGPEFVERVSEIRTQLTSVKKFIYIGDDAPEWAQPVDDFTLSASVNPLNVELNPDDPCGLYFTSGTTGQPKPILLTHKNMEHAAIVESRHHGQTKDDNFILIPPLYHTGAKMHWFGSLYTGSRATLLREIKPAYIFEAVHNEKGTIVWLLVPWAQDILVALDTGELKKEDYKLNQWRLMHIGAQPVPESLIQHWKTYFPDMLYDTNYGLSESTGPGCVHLGVENIHKVGAIGKPGYGWQVRIVDDNDNDVPAGMVGELLVKGNGLMKEYYKNPQKTAEVLKDGWLHTGDLAKTDEDGFIWYVDRKKDLIITGGENIFPIEVEEVLLFNPKIYDAALIGIPDIRLGEIAVAVIDPKPGAGITTEEIESYCIEKLPKYKRPKIIVFDKVPRNATGKIEKVKLREKYKDLKWVR